MNPIRPPNCYQFNLTCLRCRYATNSYNDLRLHFTQWKCKPFEVFCQCCADVYYTKGDLANHLNQPNVYGRLPLASDPPIASGVLTFGPSASVSAPSPSGSAALGHAVRPPPSPASSAYHSPPPRPFSLASSVSSPLSVRSPTSPASRIRRALTSSAGTSLAPTSPAATSHHHHHHHFL